MEPSASSPKTICRLEYKLKKTKTCLDLSEVNMAQILHGFTSEYLSHILLFHLQQDGFTLNKKESTVITPNPKWGEKSFFRPSFKLEILRTLFK